MYNVFTTGRTLLSVPVLNLSLGLQLSGSAATLWRSGALVRSGALRRPLQNGSHDFLCFSGGGDYNLVATVFCPELSYVGELP